MKKSNEHTVTVVYATQLPQAYRPIQGRGHWRTPVVPYK